MAEAQLSKRLGETSGEGLPIRRLRDFVLFEDDALRLISPLQLLDSRGITGMYGACGCVTPVHDEGSGQDSEDYDDGGHYVKLAIVELNVHHFVKGLGGIDENIYVKTSVAWYILDTPSLIYQDFWSPFCVLHHHAHRLMDDAFKCRSITYDQFVESLDIDEFTPDVVVLEQVVDLGAPIKHVPLIRKLLKNPTARPMEDKDVETFLMPVVARFATKHLMSPVSVVGVDEQAIRKLEREIEEVREHHGDPASMHWGECLDDEYYSSVVMDGVTYNIGDVVAVSPGVDINADRQEMDWLAVAHCVNAYANRVWFIQIKYFFAEKDEHGQLRKMFHGQWFLHASRTFFRETAHSQELCALPECQNVSVAAIFQKCRVDFLRDDEMEEIDAFDAQGRSYFCRLMYDSTTHSFLGFPRSAERYCDNCVRHGLTRHGFSVHVGDFVYVRPDISAKEGYALFIARILHINHTEQSVHVRYYQRTAADDRCICRTSRKNNVSMEDLDAKCFVRLLDPENLAEREEIESWLDSHFDHFYIEEAGSRGAANDFKCCWDCFRQHCVFAGAGGLSEGFCQSGFFNTKWAVERAFSAAETFRLNHPETDVLVTDINAFLKYAVDRRDGKNPVALRSTDEAHTPINDDRIPVPGEHITVLIGGPPCQSFSGANTSKKEEDPRSALPFAMLSVAELYRPDYVIIENVTDDELRVDNAMPKLILRELAALGYQCRVEVLQACQYGAPQNRQRVIFWGAKRGLAMPNSPVPTHTFKSADKYTLDHRNEFLPPVQRGKETEDHHICAPHASVTVADAIGDLPGFEWSNPHNIVAEGASDATEVQARIAQGIIQCDASNAPVGFREPVAYARQPSTRYQKAMRRKNLTLVENHVTDKVSAIVAEISTQIPLTPLASHRCGRYPLRSAGRLMQFSSFGSTIPQTHHTYTRKQKVLRTSC
ncbi:hypothetical protein B0H15DRAFT_367739 [Mycena belliarum]|uniref:DNA (cytosine-5-)-methyltransferase n=1 Tax=Mycena belliarum TaxID=1033014 RepID=A0AAD6U0F3_9AGAR|nr:hypothetical protein B0H15DRAFT_367739 [Mycena belliae]